MNNQGSNPDAFPQQFAAVTTEQPASQPAVQPVAQSAPHAAPQGGVIAKLKAHRANCEGEETITLEETGVAVTFPKFRSHGKWARALRLSKNRFDKAQVIYAVSVCTFDGEKLTVADFSQYLPMQDVNELMSHLFGDSNDDAEDEDEGDVGEIRTATS